MGKLQVTPKEDGQIDPAQLLKATYDSGVTAAEMDMTARGKIVKDASGSLALQVAPQSIVCARTERVVERAGSARGDANDGHSSWSAVQKAGGEKETRYFGSAEAADSRSAKEGINAERICSSVSEPRRGRTRRMPTSIRRVQLLRRRKLSSRQARSVHGCLISHVKDLQGRDDFLGRPSRQGRAD